MDAIPYVDSLVKEYLLFRGFTNTLRAFNRDLSTDRGRGFQADQLCELVFQKLLPQSQATELMEVLDFLNTRVYSRLPGSFEPVIRKLEVSILRAHLILAVQAGKTEVVKDFFSQHVELLLQQAEASDWLVWFTLPYISNPAQDERFQVYFTKEWMALVEASFRNLISQGIQHLPLPGLLHFNTDRLERQALRKQLEELQISNQLLQQQSSSNTASPSAARSDQNRPSARQQHQMLQSADKRQPRNQSAVAQQPHQQGKVPVQSKLLQGKARGSKASSTSMPAPKPINTAVKNHAAPAATVADSIQWELADNGKAKDSLLQSQAASMDSGSTGDTDATAAAALHVSSSQASADASTAGANHSSAVHTAPRLHSDADCIQSSQDGAMQPNSMQVSASDMAITRARATAELPSEAHRAAGQLSQPAARQNSFHSLPHPSQQDNATSATDAPPAAESAEASDESAGHPEAPDGAVLSELVIRGEELMGHDHAITCCSFSPNGQNLATASSDGVVRIWAPESLQSNASRAAVLLCGAPVSAVAWDNRADKIMLVGTKGKGIKAWHLDTKSMISHIQPDPSYPHVLDVACSPTDPSFVSAAATALVGTAASDADCAGMLTMWNMRAFRRLRSFDLPENAAAGSVSFSPDGQMLVAGVSDGSMRIYDVHSNKGPPVAAWGLQTDNCRAASVHYCASGTAVVSLTQSGLLQQWDLRRLSSKKLGQPQWSVDLSSFCPAAAASQPFVIACSSKAVAVNSALPAYPVVQFGGIANEPVTHSFQTPSSGDAGNAHVSAVGWHPNASVLCCGLNQGQVHLQHMNLG